MRSGLLLVCLAAVVAMAPAARAQESWFAPKNRVMSRASLAGVTPRSSWAAIQRAWGGSPWSSSVGEGGWGRSQARWRSPGLFSPPVAQVYWAGSVGQRPIRFRIDLDVAEGMGHVLRTTRGDRVGTTASAFRRHWPGARRVRSDAEHAYYSVPSSYSGWQLAFLFRNGRLKQADLVRNDFFNLCMRRWCAGGFRPQ